MVQKSKKPAKRKAPKSRKKPIRRVAAARRLLKQTARTPAPAKRGGLPAAAALDPRQLGMPWAPAPLTDAQRKALDVSPRMTATMRVPRIRARWWQAAARRADAHDWASWAGRLMDQAAEQLVGPMPTTEAP